MDSNFNLDKIWQDFKDSLFSRFPDETVKNNLPNGKILGQNK